MVQFGNFFKVKIFIPTVLCRFMGKYTDLAWQQMEHMAYYEPHGAFLDYFDYLLALYDEFEGIWRRSYPPPQANTDILQLILREIAETRNMCKLLYSKLRVDPTGLQGIQRFPLFTEIVHTPPPLKSLKKPKKGKNTEKKEDSEQ